jgi:Zn-dependent metalloprotease
MNRLLPLLFVLVCATATFAQHGKPAPAFKNGTAPQSPQLSWPEKSTVPPAENPFKQAGSFKKTLPPLVPQRSAGNESIRVTLGENGMPIMMEGQTAASGSSADTRPTGERAMAYLGSLEPLGLTKPANEFVVKTVQQDEQGNFHVRMEQIFQGLPVWGSELIAHSKNGAFERVNGRYFPTPVLNTLTPALDETAALTVVKNQIGADKIKTHWSERDLQLIDGQPFSATLLVFHRNGATNGERLAWHIVAHPNILSRLVYFVDASSGEILDHYDNTCNFVGHLDLPKGKKTNIPIAKQKW